MREGTTKDPDRELYVMHVADEVQAFVRKEYLTGALIESAVEPILHTFPRDYRPDLVISHFWDGGLLGTLLCEYFSDAVHLWVPHEPVGMKKEPLSPAQQEHHSIFIRERYEERVLNHADLVGSTSKLVRDDLVDAHGRDWTEKLIDIFPGVDTNRFSPMKFDHISGQDARRHAEFLNLPAELFKRAHICEFGRSDVLKDKDKAVEAFTLVAQETDEINMFLNLDEKMEPGVAQRIHIFSPRDLPQSGAGSHILPNIVKTAKVFLTMSVMEGFGMAVCEAAASGIPVIGTEHIPVVTDTIAPAGGGTAVRGKDIRAAVDAVLYYLSLDDNEWQEVADKAYSSVIPRYRWDNIVVDMFHQMKTKGFDFLTPQEL